MNITDIVEGGTVWLAAPALSRPFRVAKIVKDWRGGQLVDYVAEQASGGGLNLHLSDTVFATQDDAEAHRHGALGRKDATQWEQLALITGAVLPSVSSPETEAEALRREVAKWYTLNDEANGIIENVENELDAEKEQSRQLAKHVQVLQWAIERLKAMALTASHHRVAVVAGHMVIDKAIEAREPFIDAVDLQTVVKWRQETMITRQLTLQLISAVDVSGVRQVARKKAQELRNRIARDRTTG
jgi:hypothetical protein